MAREELAEALQAPSLPESIKKLKLGNKGRNLLRIFRAALQPEQLEQYVFPGGDASKLELPRPNPAMLFPLARASKTSGDPGRIFAWDREWQKKSEDARPESHHRHLSQVLRLRDEIVSVISQELAQLLSEATKKLNSKLLELVKEINTKLSLVAGNDILLDEFLRANMPGEAEPAAGPAADPLATVRQIATVTWPLGNGTTKQGDS
jgi:hypothetical protein